MILLQNLPQLLSGNKWKKARKSLFARLSGSFNDSRDAVMTLKSGF